MAYHRAVCWVQPSLLLYFFFINDLPELVSSTVHIFADDTKIYRTVNEIEDAIILQEDLNKLIEWSKKWQLKFNTKKYKVIQLDSRNAKAENIMDGMI